MSMLPIEPKVYDDGLTKQSFKDSVDINKILKRAQKTGTLSHISKYGPQYGDFSNFDFHEAQNQIARGREIFEALPSEVRRDFNNDPAEFFAFANKPENIDQLEKVLPQLAEPGRYFPDVNAVASSGQAREPQTSETTPAEPEPQTPTEPETPA